MRSSSSNMRSGHLLCLLLSLFGDVSSAAGQRNVLENIVRGRPPLPPSLRSALPGMPLASRANAPPGGKGRSMRAIPFIKQWFPRALLCLVVRVLL